MPYERKSSKQLQNIFHLLQWHIIICLNIISLNSLIYNMQNNQFVQSYTIVCLVGDGSQGQAFLARRGNENFVIKLYFTSQSAHKYYSQQVQTLSQITSPYTIRMIDHYAEARTLIAQRQEIRPAIVLQFAEHGELFKLVNAERFSQDVSRTLFFQLISAIKHLKDINITHRDIKLENILLDQRYNLKLADFGFARNSLGNNFDFYLRSWRGTESYMAPQIHTRNYKGEKVDLFAAGVVLFLMFVRIPPFENTEVSNQNYNLIRAGRIPQFWAMFQRRNRLLPPLFKSLITKLFNPAPEMRPTVQQVLADEWLKGPILTNEQLETYFQPRYERLMHRDEETRNIRRHLRQNLERMMNQHERVNQERERSRERGQNRQEGNRTQHQNIILDILRSNIHHQHLPQVKEYNLPYAKISPIMALLWLNQYITNFKQAKKSFFKDSVEDIEFTKYELKYDHKGKIELWLAFDVNCENDSATTELKLKGQIVNWANQVCISWKGEVGNEFWIYEIIQNFNEQFELTFT